MKHVVAVVGPTASGKTALAIELAEALGTEIVSADSMQFYRGMEIGTGAPTAEERARVRHHFVGILEPDQEMSAGKFADSAREIITSLNRSGKTAVVVGGSGLYVRALLDGLIEGPEKSEDLRALLQERAEAEGPSALYAELLAVDREYAESIHPNDLRRIVRALEVYELTQTPLSEHFREQQSNAESLDATQIAIDWPRDELYDRIHRRVDAMIAAGLVEEVRRLVERGFGPHIDRLRSLGYREIAAHLRGECSLENAVEAMKMHTRRYAKRQLTWFRADPRIQWIPATDLQHAEAHAEWLLYRLGLGP